MARAAREIWAKRVERWKDSGLTATEFAAEVGLNANTLKFWSSRLNTEGKAEPACDDVDYGKRRCRASRRKPMFVEITPEVAKGAPELIEIVADALVIRVPAQFDDETLRRVLVAVRSSL